jgi:hypothetical protein
MSNVFETAGSALFADPNVAAEAGYTPHGGSRKTVRIVVHFAPVMPVPHGGERTPSNVIQVGIPNDATTGVISVKEGFDKVHFKLRKGDAAETDFRVSKVLHCDDMGWRLEVQK